jgi:hypothetical protein
MMLILIPILLSIPFPAFSATESNCLTTREFITTLEFFRKDSDFKMKDSEAQDWSFQVAEGCTGAAKRFIRIAKTLSNAGANRKTAVEVALPFAKATDDQTEAFISAFKLSIAEDVLDMDFLNSTKIAKSISIEHPGDLKFALKDFEKIVKTCSNSTRFAISRKDCGSLAATIAQAGSKWEKGAADPFLETYEFLTSEKGPTLINSQAVNWSEKIISQGPAAKENFKQAYQYASSSDGLKLNRDEATRFALKMASLENQIRTQDSMTTPEKAQLKQPDSSKK